MAASEMQAKAIDVRGSGGELHLVRDLLDKQLVDRNRDPLGRADGVVLHLAEGRPPRLACIESGVTVLAARLNHRAARWLRAVARRWGLRRGRPFRIHWRNVIRVGIETELDLLADETPALAWEHWLLQHVVRHIPSLKPENKKGQHQDQKGKSSGQADAMDGPPGRQRAAGGDAGPHAGARRVRLHELLNRKVVDSTGRPAGRVEEVLARVSGGECTVEEYVLGREGLMERLSIADLSMAVIRFAGAHRTAGGHHVPWHQMDLADPARPRLRCRKEELREEGKDRR